MLIEPFVFFRFSWGRNGDPSTPCPRPLQLSPWGEPLVVRCNKHKPPWRVIWNNSVFFGVCCDNRHDMSFRFTWLVWFTSVWFRIPDWINRLCVQFWYLKRENFFGCSTLDFNTDIQWLDKKKRDCSKNPTKWSSDYCIVDQWSPRMKQGHNLPPRTKTAVLEDIVIFPFLVHRIITRKQSSEKF